MLSVHSVAIVSLALAAVVPAWAIHDKTRKCACAASTAASTSGVPDHPAGWQVDLASTVAYPKGGMYSITVSVRDAAGYLVDHARVSLRVPSFGRSGYEMVRTRRYRRGYWAVVHLRPDYQSPKDVTAVVEPGESR